MNNPLITFLFLILVSGCQYDTGLRLPPSISAPLAKDESSETLFYSVDGINRVVPFSKKEYLSAFYSKITLNSGRVEFRMQGSPLSVNVYEDLNGNLTEEMTIKGGKANYFLRNWVLVNNLHRVSGINHKITINFDLSSSAVSKYSFDDSLISINGTTDLSVIVYEIGHAWHHSVMGAIPITPLKDNSHHLNDEVQTENIVAWKGIASFVRFEYFTMIFGEDNLEERLGYKSWYQAYLEKKTLGINYTQNEFLFAKYLSEKYSFESLQEVVFNNGAFDIHTL